MLGVRVCHKTMYDRKSEIVCRFLFERLGMFAFRFMLQKVLSFLSVLREFYGRLMTYDMDGRWECWRFSTHLIGYICSFDNPIFSLLKS